MPYAFSSQENMDTKSLLNMVVMVLSSSLILGVQNANTSPSINLTPLKGMSFICCLILVFS